MLYINKDQMVISPEKEKKKGLVIHGKSVQVYGGQLHSGSEHQ